MTRSFLYSEPSMLPDIKSQLARRLFLLSIETGPDRDSNTLQVHLGHSLDQSGML